MLAMYYVQGIRIDRGPVFYGSFRKLEVVYQHLKTHAGANRDLEVDVADYKRSLPPEDKEHGEPGLIRHYVAAREKEYMALTSARTKPVTYTVCRSDQVTPGDATIAYLGNGIALVPKSAPKNEAHPP